MSNRKAFRCKRLRVISKYKILKHFRKLNLLINISLNFKNYQNINYIVSLYVSHILYF